MKLPWLVSFAVSLYCSARFVPVLGGKVVLQCESRGERASPESILESFVRWCGESLIARLPPTSVRARVNVRRPPSMTNKERRYWTDSDREEGAGLRLRLLVRVPRSTEPEREQLERVETLVEKAP